MEVSRLTYELKIRDVELSYQKQYEVRIGLSVCQSGSQSLKPFVSS